MRSLHQFIFAHSVPFIRSSPETSYASSTFASHANVFHPHTHFHTRALVLCRRRCLFLWGSSSSFGRWGFHNFGIVSRQYCFASQDSIFSLNIQLLLLQLFERGHHGGTFVPQTIQLIRQFIIIVTLYRIHHFRLIVSLLSTILVVELHVKCVETVVAKAPRQ